MEGIKDAKLDFNTMEFLFSNTINMVQGNPKKNIQRNYYKVNSQDGKYTFVFASSRPNEHCSKILKEALSIGNTFVVAIYNTKSINELDSFGLPKDRLSDNDELTNPLFEYPQQTHKGKPDLQVFSEYKYNLIPSRNPLVKEFQEKINEIEGPIEVNTPQPSPQSTEDEYETDEDDDDDKKPGKGDEEVRQLVEVPSNQVNTNRPSSADHLKSSRINQGLTRNSY